MKYKNNNQSKERTKTSREVRMETVKRKRDECCCGCSNTSVWDCYNVDLETLKLESKKLRMTTKTKEYVRKIGLEMKQVEDNSWVVEYKNPEYLVKRLRGVLKTKVVSVETQTAFEMLEDCELTEVPIRAAYVVEHLFQ